MTKLVSLCLLSTLCLSVITAQNNIGINNTSPDASAVLDITATDRGVLIPRMSTADRTAISNPAEGLMVFDSSTGSFWFHATAGWKEITELDNDSDPGNELQTLSYSNVTKDLSISNGNSVSLAGLADDLDWAQGTGVVYNLVNDVAIGNTSADDSRFYVINLDRDAAIEFLHASTAANSDGILGETNQNTSGATNAFLNRVTSISSNAAQLVGINSIMLGDNLPGTGSVYGNRTTFTGSITGSGKNLYGYHAEYLDIPLPNEYSYYAVNGNAYLGDKLGIGPGTSVPDVRLDVAEVSPGQISTIRATGVNGPTKGYLGVQGRNNFDADTTLDISGREIGVLGVSTGISALDNYGVLGHANTWGGQFQHSTSGNYARLGGSSLALDVEGNALFSGNIRTTTFRMTTGATNGYILQSDASGNASWVASTEAGLWTDNGSDLEPIGGENILSGGDFVTASIDGVINCGGSRNSNVNVIGDAVSPTITLVLGDEDLWIEDDLEVVGQGYKTGGGTWAAISDRRLKKNIVQYQDGLQELLQIDPVWYSYNEHLGPLMDGRRFVGIIAQEMQQVAPYMIEETPLFRKEIELPDGTTEVIDPGQNYLTYDASALTYMLVNAVKEQQALIEKQQQEINELKYDDSTAEVLDLIQKQIALLSQKLEEKNREVNKLKYRIVQLESDQKQALKHDQQNQ